MTRLVVALLALPLFAAPLAAEAQAAGKLVRIGILHSGSLPDANIDALRSGLRQRDYVEGRNLVIEYRAAEGELERLPGLATDLVRAKVDVIVTGGTAAIRAARDATARIPIVFAGGADPVGTGLVASLARPGGNITGVTTINVELTPKRLELLKETVPTLSRVGLLWHPASATSPRSLQELERAAGSLGVKIHTLTVRDWAGLQAALEQAGTERLQALVLVPAIFFLAKSGPRGRATGAESDADAVTHALAGHCIAKPVPDPRRLPAASLILGEPELRPTGEEPTSEERLLIEEASCEDAKTHALQTVEYASRYRPSSMPRACVRDAAIRVQTG